MKQPLILSLVITLLSGIYGYHINAQESINPLVLCAETVTLQASPTRDLRSGSTSTKEIEGAEFSFSSEEQTHPIYALAVDLSVTFTSKEGYFSILFEDQAGKQYLVYRDIAIFNQLNKPISLSNKAFETALFAFGVHPKKLMLRTSGCVVNLDKVHTATSHNNNISKIYQLRRFYTLKQDAIQSQIDRINTYNKEHNILWVAKQTSLSLRSYAENRQNLSFLDEVDAYGLEHYGGGIYTPMTIPFDEMEFLDTTTKPYVDYFDWRDRHGINWNTSCRNQLPTQSCWAQAPASALEGYIKRYYGRDENQYVSVLQIIACSGGLTLDSARIAKCGGGDPTKASLYLAKEPIMSESDFPFTNKEYQPCENKPTNPKVSYLVERVQSLRGFNREEVMSTLINKGPMVATIPAESHAMLLSGYGVIKPGLILDYWSTDTYPIPADHPLCGKVYWSFKNSYGDNFGNGGYSYFVRVKHRTTGAPRLCVPSITNLYYLSGKLTESHRPGLFYKQSMIEAYDEDGDGYYRWGLVGRPFYDVFIPKEQDGNDSNPLLGPMNEYGICDTLRMTDLYIRDVKQDKGVEPYFIDAPQWESPDIWVRQNNDKVEEHQNPNFSVGNRCYVYLRIHNKGVQPSISRAMVRLYWSYSSPTQGWDSFHGKEKTTISNGKKVVSGGEIESVAIPSIPAGGSTIIEIPWTLPAELILDQTSKEMHACLLAEITEIQDSYYLVDHRDFRKYVQANNNVAQKNVHIINVSDNGLGGIDLNDIIVINHGDKIKDINLHINYDDGIQKYETVKDQLELSYRYDQSYRTKKGLPSLPTEFIRVDSVAHIDGIRLAPKEQLNLQLKANFLVQKQTDQKEFTVRVQALDAKTGDCIGGNTYILRKDIRPMFSAEATIVDGDSKLIAHDIGESAKYIWSTSDGKEIATGKELELSSKSSLKDITLSVEATKDGFLDRKIVSLPQKATIEASPMKLYPNPTNGILSIELTDARQDGVIKITSAESGKTYYTISTQGEKILTADLTGLPSGEYLLHYYDGTALIATQKIHRL